jgi:hypothetical protein
MPFSSQAQPTPLLHGISSVAALGLVRLPLIVAVLQFHLAMNLAVRVAMRMRQFS